MQRFLSQNMYLIFIFIITCTLVPADLPAGGFNAKSIELDPTFGQNGEVRTNFYQPPEDCTSSDMEIQSDGKIVMAGTGMPEEDAPESFFGKSVGGDPWTVSINVARYNRDGSLDETFGNGGMVKTRWDMQWAMVTDVVIDSADRIIVVGTIMDTSDGIYFDDADLFLIRYTPDGLPDGTFGENGVVFVDPPMEFPTANKAVIDFRGKIVLIFIGDFDDGMQHSVCLQRFNRDGSPDTDFGANGLRVTGLVPWPMNLDQPLPLVIDTFGKILVGGFAGSDTDPDMALERYNYNGTPDSSFGDNGRVMSSTPQLDYGMAIKLIPEGKIIVAGSTLADVESKATDLYVARYNYDGSPDTHFGSRGEISFDFGGNELGRTIFRRPGGKLVIAGTETNYRSWLPNAFDSGKIFLTCINRDGSLDTEFGNGGIMTTEFFSGQGEVVSMGVQANGKMVVSGNIYHSGKDHFALSRSRFK